MLTREILDRILPEGVALSEAVRREIGKGMVGGFLSDTLEDGLLWLAEQTEADWSPSPAWRKEPEFRMASYWAVSARGVSYKPESNYLTAEGWPIGTRCWYVTVECGIREHVTGETPELAVLRGVIVFAALRRWRDTRPADRPHLETMIEAVMRGDQ